MYWKYIYVNNLAHVEVYDECKALVSRKPIFLDYEIIEKQTQIVLSKSVYPFNKLFSYNYETGTCTVIEEQKQGEKMTKYFAPKRQQVDGTLFVRVSGARRTLFASDGSKEPTNIAVETNPLWVEIDGEKALEALETGQAIFRSTTYQSETHGELVIADMHDEHLKNAVAKSLRENTVNMELVNLAWEMGKRGFAL